MSKGAEEGMTAGNIAKELGVSDGKIKKLIQELGLQPVAKKGVCSYYARDVLVKIKEKLP